MRTVTCRNGGGLGIVISLLAMVVALPATSAAQYNKSEEAQESVKVIAHIELPGMHVNSMFVQHRDNKDYLYLHRPTKQAFAVVDVTKPNKPVIVERAALPEPARARVDVNSAEPLLAISVTPEVNAEARLASTKSGNDASQINLPTETVSLVDLTNPKNPKIIKTFKGVTSYLPDDSRKLIYVVNPEGLWVVHHQQSQPMRFCTSEDALMQEPNCQ